MTRRSRIKIISIAGARPNFVKIAALVHQCQAHPDIHHLLVHTGQHYDEKMSTIFFDELAIPRPDINLEVGSHPQASQISLIMDRFAPIVALEKPDLVVVVGDVNSTVACATVAKAQGVAVAHVEAGLRSFDLSMPEERNRIETDRISDVLFVTEPAGLENLARERVHGIAYLVGNVMIDTLKRHLDKAHQSNVLAKLEIQSKQYVLSTFHRPSNVDRKEALADLLEVIRGACTLFPMVLPLHPRTLERLRRHALDTELMRIPNLILLEPLGYLEFLELVYHAKAVITDSGGVQEETTYLGIPCLTMRENTERPITVDVGTNVLVGSDPRRVLRALDAIASNNFKAGEVPALWDGDAATRIVATIRSEFGLC